MDVPPEINAAHADTETSALLVQLDALEPHCSLNVGVSLAERERTVHYPLRGDTNALRTGAGSEGL